MEAETIFGVILPLLIIAFAIHRGYYVRKHGSEENTLKKREEGLASKIAGMLGLALLGFALLQWAQNTLGKNWSDTPRMMKEQSLITSGPYEFIRHPIYTAFVLILGSTLLISANWFIGFAWIGMTVLEVASRISFEEGLMLEYFGDQYREYMKKTGRLLPKLIQ